MTIEPTDILGHIHGGRVLDVATGGGGFVGFLIEGLRDFDEIVGVDISEEGADTLAEAYGPTHNVRFEVMDAQAMTFDGGSFDTVAVSVSLHHFEDPRAALGEMLRVLRPGGHFICAEMHRDRQSPAQMTHVELHHWAAAIDRAHGIVHRETYRRSELVRLLDSLGLEAVRTFDMADTSDDPRDAATIAAHESIIERQTRRAAGHPDLERQGERIRRRLADVGIHGATELVFVGRKSRSRATTFADLPPILPLDSPVSAADNTPIRREASTRASPRRPPGPRRATGEPDPSSNAECAAFGGRTVATNLQRLPFLAPMVAALATLVAAAPVLAGAYTTTGLIDTTGHSVFAGCTADDVAGQEATFGSTNYPSSEVEPWLAVNPTDARNIVGGYQQDRWSDGGSRGNVVSLSHDGGLTWSQVALPGVTRCGGGSFDRGTDPWLDFGPDGTLWFVTQAFDVFDSRTGMLVSRSTDGGLTWSQPTDVAPNATNPPRFPFDDKVAITADPDRAGNVYVVFDEGLIPPSWTMPKNPNFKFWGSSQPTMLARTTDGGKTWEAPRVIYNPGANNFTIFNQIVVLPNGTLVDSLFEFLARKNNGGNGQFSAFFSVLRSTDQGLHWSATPVRVSPIVDTALSDVAAPQRVGGQVLAVDRNPASPGYGNLYAVWLDGRFSDGQFGDIAFSMSRDGGLTWSAPARANLTPRSHSAFTPTVAVAADGTVGVGYYDERNYAGSGPILTDVWLSHCHPSGDCTQTANWSETHVAGPFDQSQAPDAGGLFLGDYAGLGVAGNDFLPYYALSSSSDPGDVYFARVGP